MDVKIKIDDKTLQKVLGSLNPKATRKVLNKALSVAASKARKASLRLIQKEFALKTKDINGIIRMSRPRMGESSSVTIQSHPVGLDKFSPSQSKAGLTAKVKASGGSVTIPSAFLKEIKGKRLAFVRTSKVSKAAAPFVKFPSKAQPHRSKGGGELPINRLLADPVSEVVAPHAQEIANTAAQEASVVMLVEVERLLDAGLG